MPLARGSAAVGYALLLAVRLAAGRPVGRAIPAGVQADWEAILAPSPAEFEAALGRWLGLGDQEGDGADPVAARVDVGALPRVADALATPRARLAALNGPGGPAVVGLGE